MSLPPDPAIARHDHPQLFAATGSTYRSTVRGSLRREAELLGLPAIGQDAKLSGTGLEGKSTDIDESNHFSSAQWSPDGTTLLTVSADLRVRAFIVPPELLDPKPQPLLLKPYTIHPLAAAPHAQAFHPSYKLCNPASTVYVHSTASLPIALRSTLSSQLITSYPLVHTQTETYLPAHALEFLSDWSFLAASPSRLTVFDLSRREPIQTFLTPHSQRGSALGIKGQISTLALAHATGLVAAGTLTRQIGLYDCAASSLQTNTAFALPPSTSQHEGVKIEGRGVSALRWAGDGDRYLVVAERGADTALVFDIRVTGKLLNVLKGRRARGNQRLAIDIKDDQVWAGGQDGTVRIWQKPWTAETVSGGLSPDWEWKASSQAVPGVSVHPFADVVATGSGQRTFADNLAEQWNDEDEVTLHQASATIDERYDNHLSIWATKPDSSTLVEP